MKQWISIIIPVYNVEKYLEKCVQSIIDDVEEVKNDLKNAIEVILVDDGSTDRSGEIADSFAAVYPYISVIHKQNAGVAAARNTGMKIAKGEWLYFMDSDDWLAKGAVEILCRRGQEFCDMDVILFDAWKNRDQCEQTWEHFSEEKVWDTREDILSLQRGMLYYPSDFRCTKVSLAAPWDKLYRRSFICENHICFTENLRVLDDMIFNMEVFGQAGKVCYCKDKIYHYRYVPDSITNSYKADRIDRDCEVWAYIRTYLQQQVERNNWSVKEQQDFLQSFYCRIVKSFSICCRLCFFHRKNRKSFHEKLLYVKEILMKSFYQEAFHNAKLQNAEWKLKAVILFGRVRWVFGIYLLHAVNEAFTKV